MLLPFQELSLISLHSDMKVGVSISLTPPFKKKKKKGPFHKALVNNTNFTKMFTCETLHNTPTYICSYVVSNQCSLLSLLVHSLFCTSVSYHSCTHDCGLGLGQYKSIHTNSLFFFFPTRSPITQNL